MIGFISKQLFTKSIEVVLPTLEMIRTRSAGARSGRYGTTIRQIMAKKAELMPEDDKFAARGPFAQASQPTLGQVLDAFEKRYEAGTLELLTQDERRAQLDRTIANAEAFEKRNSLKDAPAEG